jgi:DNA-binding protein Fis
MSGTQKPTCFVIAPIGPNESDIRRRSDKVLKHIFRKALAEKYEVIRGDEIDEPGMITSQVLRAVQEAALVVADLTGHNPNVLYELAVRHAIEKPIIHAIEPKLSKIPFDIAGFRTIEFDLTDPDSIESAVEQLKKQTEQAEKGKWGETPVKLANIMQRSREDSKDTVLLKQAVEGIAALRVNVGQLSEQFNRMEGPLGTRYYTGVVPGIGMGKMVSLSTLANPQYAYTDDGALFQVPSFVQPSETLAAQTQLRQASQPDQVPPPKPTQTVAEKLRVRPPR